MHPFVLLKLPQQFQPNFAQCERPPLLFVGSVNIRSTNLRRWKANILRKMINCYSAWPFGRFWWNFAHIDTYWHSGPYEPL